MNAFFCLLSKLFYGILTISVLYSCSDENCIYENPNGPFASGSQDQGGLVSPQPEPENTPTGTDLIIIQAIQNDNLQSILDLFQENSNLINKPIESADNLTALMLAAKWGRLEIVAELIMMGADRAISTESGLTAAYFARESGYNLLARYLEESLSQSDLNLALFDSAGGEITDIQFYIRLGADPNYVKEGAGNILMQAITSQRLENVEALLALGADPSLKTTVRGRQINALEYAQLTRANPDIIELLSKAIDSL